MRVCVPSPENLGGAEERTALYKIVPIAYKGTKGTGSIGQRKAHPPKDPEVQSWQVDG